jgi:hypothetical protein
MKIAAVIAIAIAAAGTAHAGLYVETVRRDRATGAVSSDDKMYVQNGLARLETSRVGEYTIFKDDGVYHVNAAERSYRVMDKAAMDQMSSKMNDMMAKMKAQVANMPPERRAAMEKMMSQMNGRGAGAGPAVKPAVYDAVDTGKSESSNGRSCRIWNVTRNGELDEQYCVAPKGSMPGMEEFIAFARKMSSMMEQMSGPMHKMGAGFMQQQIAVLEKINGVPLITRHFSGGKLGNEETVVKTWEPRSIPAAQFDVPAGYTRLDFMSRGH